MKNSAGCGIFVKKEGNRDQAPPLSFQTLVLVTRSQIKVEFYSGPTAGEVSRKTNLLISF